MKLKVKKAKIVKKEGAQPVGGAAIASRLQLNAPPPQPTSRIFISGVHEIYGKAHSRRGLWESFMRLSMLIPARRISSTTATRIPFNALATTGMVMAFCKKAEIKSSTRKEGSTMPRVAVNAPFIPACLSPV